LKEEDKKLLEKAMEVNDKCMQALKVAQDTIHAINPSVEEYRQIILLVKDYMNRLVEGKNNKELIPNAHDYIMMIAKIMSNKL